PGSGGRRPPRGPLLPLARAPVREPRRRAHGLQRGPEAPAGVQAGRRDPRADQGVSAPRQARLRPVRPGPQWRARGKRRGAARPGPERAGRADRPEVGRGSARVASAMVAYTLEVSQPQARRAEVSLECDTRAEASRDGRLPPWTPGSYLIREHQRHVDGFSASDDSGRELPFEKVDKQTWRIRSDGARRVRISYRLGCFELTVRTNHVDGTHAFLNPAATCAFVVGRESQPCTVKTELPAGWQTWVALPAKDGVYQAED